MTRTLSQKLFCITAKAEPHAPLPGGKQRLHGFFDIRDAGPRSRTLTCTVPSAW